jgi:hypothetical protein
MTQTRHRGGPAVLRMILARQLGRAGGALKPLTLKGPADRLRPGQHPPWWHGLRRRAPRLVPHRRRPGGSRPPHPRLPARVIPGLLQTEGYLTAITAASFPAATPQFSQRAVARRLTRQQLLSRADPPRYRAVPDASAPRRPIGGPQVMRGKTARSIYRPGDQQLPGIACTGAPTGTWYLSRPGEPARYTEALDRMCAQPAAPGQTPAIRTATLKET